MDNYSKIISIFNINQNNSKELYLIDPIVLIIIVICICLFLYISNKYEKDI